MKTSSNKRFSRKHDRNVLVAEESTKSWADSDSDSSSSSSSSSDSEQDEVHCFMADQTDDDERLDKLKRQRIDWLRQISRCFLQSISADSWLFNSLFISADGYSEYQPADDVNQQLVNSSKCYFSRSIFDNVDEVTAGDQSYSRLKLKLIQIRSFTHLEKIRRIAQLPGIKETS
ncbi:hypothetical protein F511_37244 [Dorcoceras hygrometricum]|uniref:Uncharacterized protein n=1 Tax=Dorcoceras hygrometricum TaxID=472368 RepID=A0A2Z7AZ30_9LAMI|nr:hypothetical protein F511_37244 [Dorcoceras hygrometricum]